MPSSTKAVRPLGTSTETETPVELDEHIRRIVREEVSSLSGMMLRRLQDMGPTRSFERNMAVEVLQQLWGEALRDFGSTSAEPGT